MADPEGDEAEGEEVNGRYAPPAKRFPLAPPQISSHIYNGREAAENENSPEDKGGDERPIVGEKNGGKNGR